MTIIWIPLYYCLVFFRYCLTYWRTSFSVDWSTTGSSSGGLGITDLIESSVASISCDTSSYLFFTSFLILVILERFNWRSNGVCSRILQKIAVSRSRETISQPFWPRSHLHKKWFRPDSRYHFEIYLNVLFDKNRNWLSQMLGIGGHLKPFAKLRSLILNRSRIGRN